MTTFERMVQVFNAVFEDEVNTQTFRPEAKLREDVGINSIGMLYMAMAMEEEFGIKFANEDFTKMETVADVVAIVESKL